MVWNLSWVRYDLVVIESKVVPMKSRECMGVRTDFSVFTLIPSKKRR